jgi:FkbM family methyltransferase
MADRKVIYDVGLHRGEDSEFYLKKGFRVVAIDANPEMCATAAQRLRAYCDNGQLVIVNKAIATEEGEVTFFKNKNHSEWGTIDHAWMARNLRHGDPSEEFRVQAAPLSRVIAEFGAPYFVKIDIEGLDLTAVRSLRGAPDLPRYVSIESEKVSFTKLREEFALFTSLGYDRFKLVAQHRVTRQAPPRPALEGDYVNHRFEVGSSGLFGEEAPGRWLTAEQAIEAYKPIFLRYHLTGDDPLLRSRLLPRALRALGLRPGWYDTHAKLGASHAPSRTAAPAYATPPRHDRNLGALAAERAR